jgi:hypothetical protein
MSIHLLKRGNFIPLLGDILHVPWNFQIPRIAWLMVTLLTFSASLHSYFYLYSIPWTFCTVVCGGSRWDSHLRRIGSYTYIAPYSLERREIQLVNVAILHYYPSPIWIPRFHHSLPQQRLPFQLWAPTLNRASNMLRASRVLGSFVTWSDDEEPKSWRMSGNVPSLPFAAGLKAALIWMRCDGYLNKPTTVPTRVDNHVSSKISKVSIPKVCPSCFKQ